MEGIKGVIPGKALQQEMPIEDSQKVVHWHYIAACCFQPWLFILFALLLLSVTAVVYRYFMLFCCHSQGAADLGLTRI